jgi:hypothetical protein
LPDFTAYPNFNLPVSRYNTQIDFLLRNYLVLGKDCRSVAA